MITIDVEECKERNGSALEDRPERVDEVLSSEQRGFKEGQPLVGDSYNDYPDDYHVLSDPKWSGFVESLLFHPRVGSYADGVSELCGATSDTLLSKWLKAVETAASLANIDTDAAFAEYDEPPDKSKQIETILNFDVSEELIDAENPLFVSMLYVTGLSVSEIADVLDANKNDIRDVLISVNLIGGKTRARQKRDFAENGGRTTSTVGGYNRDAVESSSTVNIISR